MSGRLDMAQRFFDAARMELVSGTATPARLYFWSFRVLDAEREVQDEASACSAHLERMKALHSAVSDRARSGLAESEVESTALCYVLEAELWLRSARGEDPTEIAHQLTRASREAYRGLEERLKSDRTGVEETCLASVRLLQADLDLGQVSERSAYQQHLDRVHSVEQRARRWLRDGKLEGLEAMVGAFFRWEAEYLFSLLNAQRRTRSKAFADRRLTAARETYEELRGTYEAGRGMADALALWSLRWMRAARDANEETGGDPRAAETLDAHLERLVQLQAHLRATQPIGVALDLGALEYFVLEAECWIRAG
ncbi:MAG: hypothetical protein KDD82_29240 [Planctomycetes bacterium]|nr:hypothetical protein [Planctomycetota bacterium]